MTDVESLRAVVRAQNLSDSLRRPEFQAILEALVPEESVLALAPGEFRGREGYLVATDRRLFFAHAGVAGTFVAPIAFALDALQYVENRDGSVSLVFKPSGAEEIQLDRVPRAHAEVLARSLTRWTESDGAWTP